MRMIERVATTLLVAALAACTKVGTQNDGTSGGEGTRGAHTVPHTLRFAEAEDVATLNPTLVQQGVVSNLSDFTMAWLFRYDRTNRPVPELATEVPTQANGDISADGRTIKIKLRRGVKWSDGVAFDADDVIFSVGVMNNPSNNITSRAGFELVTKMDEPDKYTVLFHLKRPFSAFLPIFFTTGGAEPCLMPKHILGNLPNINTAPYNSLPVGIGPFKYAAWKRGDSIEMVPNPLYWRGTPKLKSVVYKIISDRNTVATQLRTGEVDLWWPVPGHFFRGLEGTPGLAYVRQPSYFFNHFDFNVTHPALRDRVVREALRMATNRPLLREKVAYGVGILQESTIPPTYPGAPKNIPFVAFDLAKANALLDAAGWKRGPDGVRSKNGVRLSVEFATSIGTPDVDTQLELIRGWWKQIGVDMTIKRYLSSLLFEAAASGGILEGGKFDVMAYATGNEAVDDPSQAFSCRNLAPHGQDTTHYCNSALEPLFDAFHAEYDEARQAAILARIDQTVRADVPTFVTVYREDIFMFNKDLQNFHPNAVSPFDDMLDVDI